jgi:F-type H+-transporting ATPase subunit delta
MAKRSDNSILVRRYAAAWVAAAGAPALPKLATEAAALQASLANDMRLTAMLDDPTIDRNILAAAFKTVAEKSGMSKLTSQFLSVLTAAGRLALLPKILASVQILIDAASGIQHAKLASAAPLPATAVKELQNLLSQKMGNDVHLVTTVDENLLGGVQIEMNSWLIDASLAGQLSRLERHLKSLPQAA